MCVELGMWEAKLFMGVEKHHSSLAKARKFALKFEEESMTIVHNTPPPLQLLSCVWCNTGASLDGHLTCGACLPVSPKHSPLTQETPTARGHT